MTGHEARGSGARSRGVFLWFCYRCGSWCPDDAWRVVSGKQEQVAQALGFSCVKWFCF